MATYNLGASAKGSDDPEKTDLEWRCDRCGAHLCDVEDGDWGGTLMSTTAKHYTAEHGGDQNFELPACEAGEDGILLTREQLNEWAGYELTEFERDDLEESIPNSAIPEAINTIAAQFRG